MKVRRHPSEASLGKARRAKALLKKKLKGHPDVVAIGIGYRERGGHVVLRMCVRVHVRTSSCTMCSRRNAVFQ